MEKNRYKELLENEIKLISEDIIDFNFSDIIDKLISDINIINQLMKIEYINYKQKKIRRRDLVYNSYIHKIYTFLLNTNNLPQDTNLSIKNCKYLFYLLIKNGLNYEISEIIFNSILLRILKLDNDTFFYYNLNNNTDFKNISYFSFLEQFDTIFNKIELYDISNCYEINIINVKPIEDIIIDNFLDKVNYKF